MTCTRATDERRIERGGIRRRLRRRNRRRKPRLGQLEQLRRRELWPKVDRGRAHRLAKQHEAVPGIDSRAREQRLAPRYFGIRPLREQGVEMIRAPPRDRQRL